MSWLPPHPPSTHLLQDDTCRLVDGPAHVSVLARVANEGPRQHGYHDHAHGAITHQGKGGEAYEQQHPRQHVEKTHEDKEHRWCPEGAEEVLRLWREREREKEWAQVTDTFSTHLKQREF